LVDDLRNRLVRGFLKHMGFDMIPNLPCKVELCLYTFDGRLEFLFLFATRDEVQARKVVTGMHDDDTTDLRDVSYGIFTWILFGRRACKM